MTSPISTERLKHLATYNGGWNGAPADAEKRAMARELLAAREALNAIANEPEVHTKLNQERLCCKFQDIAARALSGNRSAE